MYVNTRSAILPFGISRGVLLLLNQPKPNVPPELLAVKPTISFSTPTNCKTEVLYEIFSEIEPTLTKLKPLNGTLTVSPGVPLT